MSAAQLQTPIAPLTAQLAGRPLDAALQARLNAQQAVGSAHYTPLEQCCRAGVAAGWLCNRGGGGLRYGRALALYLLPQGQLPFTR